MSDKPFIHVVVGIINNENGQVLIAKRPHHWMGGGFWEFPGGKIEPGESEIHALKRELLEEVGVKVKACSALLQLEYEYPERTVYLHAWWIDSYTGVASGVEGQEIRWVSPFEISHVNMLPANHTIVKATQIRKILFLNLLLTSKTKRNLELLFWWVKELSQEKNHQQTILNCATG